MMRKSRNFTAMRTLLISTCLFSAPLMAVDIDYTQEGQKCAQQADRIQRLLCFDTLFKSPVAVPQVVPSSQETPQEQAYGPIRTVVSALEKQRAQDDNRWLMRVRPWHEDVLLTPEDYRIFNANASNHQRQDDDRAEGGWGPTKIDIFMTMKEADVSADRSKIDEAIMILSCENDITTLGVVLPKPIKTLQANLSLSAGKGSVFKLNWRDVENGNVVIAGRGLESIDTIKTITNYSRVQLQVNYPDGPRAFIFDINDLKEQLKPLRTACHW